MVVVEARANCGESFGIRVALRARDKVEDEGEAATVRWRLPAAAPVKVTLLTRFRRCVDSSTAEVVANCERRNAVFLLRKGEPAASGEPRLLRRVP